MTQEHAEREYEKLGEEYDLLFYKIDEYESKVNQLKNEIKEQTREVTLLTRQIKSKSDAILKLQNEIKIGNFRIKQIDSLREYLEEKFEL